MCSLVCFVLMILGPKLLESCASLLRSKDNFVLISEKQFTSRLQKVVFEIMLLPEVEKGICHFEGS